MIGRATFQVSNELLTGILESIFGFDEIHIVDMQKLQMRIVNCVSLERMVTVTLWMVKPATYE